MGMCKPSGGVNKYGIQQNIEKQFGSTRIKDEDRIGKANTRIDLYRDEQHQTIKDWLASRWYGPDGRVENDRDGTDHGWKDAHEYVPHDHPYTWKRGQYQRKSKGKKPDYNNYC